MLQGQASLSGEVCVGYFVGLVIVLEEELNIFGFERIFTFDKSPPSGFCSRQLRTYLLTTNVIML